MAKDLSQAARNTSNKAQKTSKDRFDKADILLAKKEVSFAAKNTKNTVKKKKADIVQDSVVPCQFKLLQSEDNLIDSIKLRFAIQGMTLNKSEILRTAIKALERQTDKQLKTTFSSVEKIKASEDHSAALDLKSVEHYSAAQQIPIDKSNDEHISNIKAAHEKQLLLQESHITELRGYIESYKQQIDKQGLSQESHITELRKDIDYYKQQIDKQQQTIDNLHHSYDTVMTSLLEEKRIDHNIRELSADAGFEIDKNNERLKELATSPQSTLMTTPEVADNQQSTDIADNQQATDIADNQQATDIADNQQATDIADNLQSTDIADNQQSAGIADNQQSADIEDNQQSTDIEDNQQSTDREDNQQSADIADNQQSADIEDNQQSADIADNHQSADIADNQQSADIADNQQSTDIADNQQSADIEDNQQSADIADNQQSADIEDNLQSADIEITAPLCPSEQILPEPEQLFAQAVIMRQEAESEKAFLLFEQAAKRGHSKAMGAMGRSYFLGEGIDEDQLSGLAWLINAAEQNLPPAVTRVKYFQENDADLYQEALILSAELYQAE
ncbi:hypothetical protein CXF85_16020 [Colwellia sp. 75C3]|uniref:hypothetical protein n=1 Tax=Colwellia sp. 75C3 TaxID=888425 RepID=UPI000C32F043|nr:hypothetical protein [Colwellia sp. 75C3]PKG82031.1 hypothetical protein CXF85_16020 [Colwellia sp. 75C3]